MNAISDPAPGRRTTYASPSIVQRRERMLSETWKLISERGPDGFSIPELCRRAGVSQGTFHNAFGTKENVVGLAVVEYAATVVAGGSYAYGDDTIAGRLERLVRVNTNILRNKRYIAAVLKFFWSSGPSAKLMIGDITKRSFLEFLQKLERRKGVAPQIDVAELADTMMLNYYAVLTSWSADLIPDEQLCRRVATDVLLLLGGALRGSPARNVREWQQEVAEQGPKWREMLRLAAERTVSVDVP